jgi:RNA polymerase sigma-70 factor (ECF subfamily)
MIEARVQTGWEQLTARLRQFVARRVASADVDDVVQEALLRIQSGLPRLRDGDRFGPWVYRVTRSAVADHLRGRARRLESSRTSVDEGVGATSDESDDMIEALVGCLSVFVAELPSPYRQAITLTELERLSQREAAEVLGLSISGMKSRVQRGRERLREMFERCCELTQDVRGHVIACEPRSGCSPSEAATASVDTGPTNP